MHKSDVLFWKKFHSINLNAFHIVDEDNFPNTTPRRLPSYLLLTLLLYLFFIFYLPWCTLPDFPLYLPSLPCHLIIDTQLLNTPVNQLKEIDLCS